MTSTETYTYEPEVVAMFLQRNQHYVKHSDVPPEVIAKYTGVLPEAILTIWQQLGFGIFEDGFLQLINPDEYEFIFQYVDKLLEPTIPWGITALGDILCWEGNKGWTIAPDEGNRVLFINVRNVSNTVLGELDFVLNRVICDNYGIADKDFFNSKPYLQIKGKLPKLAYGQCYGYVPIPALGGKQSSKTLQVVDAKAYIDLIGQSVGKFINLDY